MLIQHASHSLAIVSNTTCPASQQELGYYSYCGNSLKRVLSWDLNPSLPIPLNLIMVLVKINRLRYQIAAGKALDKPLASSVREIFTSIDDCDLEVFSHPGYIATQKLSYPIAAVFQCGVRLFAILTLPRPAVLAFFSAAPAGGNPDAYNELRNKHRRHLVALARQIDLTLRHTSAIYWPLIVAGVAAATEEAGEQDRECVAKLLYKMWKQPLSPLQKMKMLEKLREFWQSGETEWEACFREPILCW